jgi:excisionase family DNA binding protein
MNSTPPRRSHSAATPPFPSLLNVAQIAELLDLSPQRVYQLAKVGTIPSVRIGRTLRFEPDTIKRWLQAGGSLGPTSPVAAPATTAAEAADEQGGPNI